MDVDKTPSPEEPPPVKSRDPAPDSWEDAAEDASTPDGDEDEDAEGEEVVARIKKKPARPEETASKKEHINVVFIGHVGKFDINCCYVLYSKIINVNLVSCQSLF